MFRKTSCLSVISSLLLLSAGCLPSLVEPPDPKEQAALQTTLAALATPEFGAALAGKVKQNIVCVATRKVWNNPKIKEPIYFIFLAGQPLMERDWINKIVRQEIERVIGKPAPYINVRYVSGSSDPSRCQELMQKEDYSPP